MYKVCAVLSLSRRTHLQCLSNPAMYISFQCEDQKVEGLYEALKRAGNRFSSVFPSIISLSLHSSSTYIGFFLGDGPANIIKSFATAFATEAAALAGNSIGPLKVLAFSLVQGSRQAQGCLQRHN